MADWGEILAGALAGGIGNWATTQSEIAKSEREAERDKGLEAVKQEWEAEKLQIQLEANKELNKQKIDADKDVADAAAKRADAKEEKDDKWEQQKWESDQKYKEDSLKYQAASAGKPASEVQLMEYLDNKGLLGSYLDQKTGANNGEDIVAKSYVTYMGKSSEAGEDPLPFSDYKNKYFPDSTSASATSDLNPAASLIQRAKAKAAAKNDKPAGAIDLSEEPSLLSGH